MIRMSEMTIRRKVISLDCAADETHAEPEDERHDEPALSFLMEASTPESMSEIAQRGSS